MKKTLAIILSLIMVFTIIPMAVSVSAYTNGYYNYNVSNGEAIITKCYTSISGNITIPSTLGGCPVTSIGDYAFSGCTSLTSVTIGNSVTSIGDYAFSGCTSLTSVTIGNSVTSIGDYAFYDCSSITNINVSENNNSYTSTNGVLFNKDKTEIICYPAGKTDKSYIIPNSVTSIGRGAFCDCYSLTSVTIPDSVTSIGNGAFDGCSTNLIIYGKADLEAEKYAKNHNINFFATSGKCGQNVTFSFNKSTGTLTISGKGEMYNYYYNEEYTNSLFFNSHEIKTLIIGNGITSIGRGAFTKCTSLTSITIPNSVTSIGSGAFCDCYSLTSVTIPDSVTWIGDYAFYDCSSLTSITIGDSWIGYDAFSGCYSLKEVNISDITSWCNIEFSSYYSNPLSYAKNLYLNGKKITNLNIPNGVRKINDYAFYNYSSLISVTIPSSVKSIGNGAFSGCDLLTSVTIPNSVTSIGERAFYGCNKFKTLYIPNSVEKIGTSALANTTSLTDLYYGGSKRKWLEQAYPTSDKDLLYVNIHFDAKVVTKNAKKATYFAKGYTGDKVVGSIVLEKGKAIAQLKLATPKFSVTAGKKLFKVKYTKVTGATGFQLRYKISGKWTTKNFDTKKTITKTINKLKSGKKYTVQIRAFVKSGKKTAYSGWASAKKVKIK